MSEPLVSKITGQLSIMVSAPYLGGVRYLEKKVAAGGGFLPNETFFKMI